MGHEVNIIYQVGYRQQCSYIMKKIDEIGFSSGRKKYECQKRRKFHNAIINFKPNVILFVNYVPEFVDEEDLYRASKSSRIILLAVDSLAKKETNIEPMLPYEIYTYEPSDIEFIKHKTGISIGYCPIGYNNVYKKLQSVPERYIDVSFVGSPYPSRIKTLNKVASVAKKKNWNVKFYGPFFRNTYPWKKWKWDIKHPILKKYIINGSISSGEIADIYRKSKICLNLHGNDTTGLNPRTFEILATGSFELVEADRDFRNLIVPEHDVGVFNDADDLVNKIDYYLSHEDERNSIARNGYEKVRDKISMAKCLESILFDGE